MALGWTTIRTAVVAALVTAGVAACEPLPPRLQLTVDSALAGADDDPGDGVCSAAAAGGACTLRAAFDEGNAAPDGADLTVGAGTYRDVDTTITGDVAVHPGSPGAVAITDTTLVVAPGARLAVTGINTSTSIQAVPPSLPDNPSTAVDLLRLDVSGTVVVAGSILGGLDIATGGGALLVDSIVEFSTVNHGALAALRSSLLASSANGASATALTTGPGGTSLLTSSVVAVPWTTLDLFLFEFPGGEGTCAGSPPASGSFAFVEVPCGALDGEGDGSGDGGTTLLVGIEFTGVGYRQDGSVHGLRSTSPLVDAIPVGHASCPAGAVDVYGHPRGIDGDGDGIGGCDIGAVELQP
jgi:hypothetical protein